MCYNLGAKQLAPNFFGLKSCANCLQEINFEKRDFYATANSV